ncbi:hypothetical protein E3E12_07880 [Formicincola oecophyllae]|uniref:Uncharacterized protein n=1 Tax=Formicincola oecophyllae TaxID=2558361 RepID=A0A4Y6UDL8_9PROT|nr:hypothetical protein [Formicincola oecophyllae]QDH14115.1 hypothetical protein E3E12_07880 [Formicincola oecophyllae]
MTDTNQTPATPAEEPVDYDAIDINKPFTPKHIEGPATVELVDVEGYERKAALIHLAGHTIGRLSHEGAVDEIDVDILEWDWRWGKFRLEVLRTALLEARDLLLKDGAH